MNFIYIVLYIQSNVDFIDDVLNLAGDFVVVGVEFDGGRELFQYVSDSVDIKRVIGVDVDRLVSQFGVFFRGLVRGGVYYRVGVIQRVVFCWGFFYWYVVNMWVRMCVVSYFVFQEMESIELGVGSIVLRVVVGVGIGVRFFIVFFYYRVVNKEKRSGINMIVSVQNFFRKRIIKVVL